ncbi:MAG: SDR family oxidoreductase [Ferrovibrio sp.]
MKIVVIGGTGLIGSQLVKLLQAKGHEALAASPRNGINAVTGEGLAAALAGAQVMVDVSNSPSFEDRAVLEFFRASTGNLLSAEAVVGVQHHVALSVVGTDRLPGSGYFRAKLAQEKLIAANGKVPYTILRATQFFEFIGAIAQSGGTGDTIRMPAGAMQPVAAADVVAALADVALAAPLNGIADLAGPERRLMADFVRQYLVVQQDMRQVVADPAAPYFGAVIDDAALVPAGAARIAPTRFADWLAKA